MIRRLLSWLLSNTSDERLRQRVIHSGVWATLLNVSDRALSLGTTVVLANLLVPSDFGVVGIATLLVAVLRTVTTIGITETLVQHEQDDVDAYLDTALTIKLVRGVVIVGAILLITPFAGPFFGEPRLGAVLPVVALGPLLNMVENPAVAYFRKELDFRKQFVYRVSGAVGNALVAVGSALLIGNLWAIVFGLLASEVARSAVTYVVHDYRPRPGFDRQRARELLSFGKWLQFSSIIVFVATKGDDLFVGWYLTSGALGLYQLAFRLSNAPTRELSHVISRVGFPTYSKLQNEPAALRRAYRITVELTLLLAVPAAAGVALIAPEFTAVFLGPEWVPMVPALQVLALGGVIRALVATGGSLFVGTGAPRWDVWMNVPRTLTIVATILPLTDRFGITGAAVSITLGIATTVPIWLYKSRAITGLPLAAYARSVVTPVLAAGVMAVPVFLVKASTPLAVGAAVAVGLVTYPVAAYGLLRAQGRAVVAEAKSLGGLGS
jgi:O-antigen/teichoic acid export membrane protein